MWNLQILCSGFECMEEEVFLAASLGEAEQDKGSDNDIPEKKDILRENQIPY